MDSITRSTADLSVGVHPYSTGGQYNPSGGNSGQTSGAANNDVAMRAVHRQN
ncbi:hypothetical protein HK097_001674, partial [Rhizophlyctis rosea]